MWVLTTRNRPAMCQEVLDACFETCMSSPGIVWTDGCRYPDLKAPGNWTLRSDDEHLNIGEIMRRVFAEYPDEGFYGWMSDDCPPVSNAWDRHLIREAGAWNIAYPNDQWQCGRKEGVGAPHVTSIVCLGGDLVRAMGGWVPPGMIQMYIDDCWEHVGNALGLMRYRADVLAEHRHFANGKRPRDETDARTFKGEDFQVTDQQRFLAFAESDVVERVRCALSR